MNSKGLLKATEKTDSISNSNESSNLTTDKLRKQQDLIERQSKTIDELKSTISQLKDELLRTQKLNRELQNSNDDLRNKGGVATRAEVDRVTATANEYRVENARLQSQVSMSSVEAVQSAQAERNAAKYRADRAQEEAERAKNRADKAEADAKRKYDDQAKDRQNKYTFLGYCAFLMMILQFAFSARCRTDTVEAVRLIGTVMGALFDWEHPILSVLSVIVIIIAALIGIVFLCKAYHTECVEKYTYGEEKASLRTQMVAFGSFVGSMYAIEILPEWCNVWLLFLVIQLIYLLGNVAYEPRY